ncbi:MAG: chemotaxis protein CheW [Gammaproteobacteria bacterium]|jgi:purine-binding chemotaxis protein CheW|nr:chemotaxis protein CheW [Gammaproteobacteria bacterium]
MSSSASSAVESNSFVDGTGGPLEAVQQCLTFFCAGEEYGIDILRVQEIKGWSGVTSVPRTPEYVLGVMNLRGVIVPVINLRRRFGLEARDFDASTVVVVVRVQMMHGTKTVGIAVDGVSEVCTFSAEAVTSPPRTGGRTEQAFASGLATVDGRMVTILDIDTLIVSALEDF